MTFQHAVSRWGGGVDWDNPTQIPNGVAVVCKNTRFRAESPGTRYGRQHTMSKLATSGGVTGLDVLNVLVNNPGQVPILFTDSGLLLKESPAGSGNLVPISPPLVLPLSAYMQDALAYNRMYMAISDMTKGLIPPLVIDGPSGVVSLVGQNPTGALWAQNTFYQIGDLVRSPDGRWWRCDVASTVLSGPVPPSWPSTNGHFAGGNWIPATVTDSVSNSVWEEWTPNCAQYLPAPDVTGATTSHIPGGGTITSGKDLYIKVSYIIPQTGESPRSPALVFVNTSANDKVTLTFGSQAGPFMPSWMAQVNLQSTLFYPFTMNVWIAAVTTGASAPADSAYGLYAASQPVNQSVVVSSLTVGSASGQSVVSIAVTSQGSYSAVPTATLTGGGGTGATCLPHAFAIHDPDPPYAITGYKVISVFVLTGGQGYTSPPTVVFSPGGGGAAATATLGSNLPGGTFYPQGCAIALLTPGNSPVFIGEAGTRYMIVLRENLNASLSPVDPGSPIPLNFTAQVSANIISIVRDSSGNVTATVDDVTGFSPSQNVVVQGCTTVGTLNGTFAVTNVQQTLAPSGIVQWVDSAHPSAVNDNTGALLIPAGPPPVAFLPPGGPSASQHIAAFTVAAPQDGQPIALQAGPYTYLPSSNPAKNFSTPILSMSGPEVLTFAGVTLTRATGGMVSVALTNIAGVLAGALITVSAGSDASFDGSFVLTGVASGTGTAGVATWTQTDTASATTTATVTVQTTVSGQVEATVQDASGLAVGDVVNVAGAAPSVFNGPVTLATVLGNVVTFPSIATGAATTPGTMSVIQDLPTTASAQSVTATSLVRDFAGNVTAQVPSLAGWGTGQTVKLNAPFDATFSGMFELTSANLNNDGVTATLTWIQTGQSTAGTTPGAIISSITDFLVNFDDNFLSNGQDVTSQLTAIPPPPSTDVYYSETLDRMIYTRGGDTQHYFSNIGDAENINQSGGILGVAASNGAPTVCFREMKSGELLSLKSNAGYAIEQNSLTPNQWTPIRRWKDHGPVNARAAALGPDFLIIFDEYTGPYRYHQGELTWIGQEKQGTWDRVNWAAKQTIVVEVDDDNKTIHFLVPLDGATSPNKDVTMNYFNGWQDPLISNMMGQVIPNRYARRWSEDDVTAKSMKVVKRSLNPPVDSRINDKQLLFGRSDQGVNAVFVDTPIPDYYSDDAPTQLSTTTISGAFPPSSVVTVVSSAGMIVGMLLQIDTGPQRETVVIQAVTSNPDSFTAVFTKGHAGGVPIIGPYLKTGIDWQYQPAYADSPTCDVLRLVKFKGQLIGSGTINFQPLIDDPSVQVEPVTVIADDPISTKSFSRGMKIQDSSNVGININNGAQPDAWAQMHKLILGGNEQYPSEKTE